MKATTSWALLAALPPCRGRDKRRLVGHAAGSLAARADENEQRSTHVRIVVGNPLADAGSNPAASTRKILIGEKTEMMNRLTALKAMIASCLAVLVSPFKLVGEAGPKPGPDGRMLRREQESAEAFYQHLLGHFLVPDIGLHVWSSEAGWLWVEGEREPLNREISASAYASFLDAHGHARLVRVPLHIIGVVPSTGVVVYNARPAEQVPLLHEPMARVAPPPATRGDVKAIIRRNVRRGTLEQLAQDGLRVP